MRSRPGTWSVDSFRYSWRLGESPTRQTSPSRIPPPPPPLDFVALICYSPLLAFSFADADFLAEIPLIPHAYYFEVAGSNAYGTMLGARIQFLFKISFCLLWLIRPCLSCGMDPVRFVFVIGKLIYLGGLVHGELAFRSRYLFALQHNPHALSQYPYLLHGMAKVNATEDDFPGRIANWLQYYNSSILAGSFMPDWYYPQDLVLTPGAMAVQAMTISQKQVRPTDSRQEYHMLTRYLVHWPPFLKAAVEHVRETYPNPATNSKAQALIAFLFGVAGHQVQDAAWHSIGLLMGFIDEVSKVECASYGFAHETLDWGGETVLGKRYTGMKGAVDWAFVCIPIFCIRYL